MIKFDKIESVFFNVLEDLRDYLDSLTLVGGWMPYVYTRFLVKADNPSRNFGYIVEILKRRDKQGIKELQQARGSIDSLEN